MGGGTDLDEAFRWLCDRADGGDFLILRAHGDDDYNPYVQKLCHLNSVATLILPDRTSSARSFSVIDTITHAAAIFIAGGDQARYINFWARNSPSKPLLRAVQFKNGVPIGGTSAGSRRPRPVHLFRAKRQTRTTKTSISDEALADPFYHQVVIAPDLLGIPILRGIITDTHFDTRHREGRLLVFMARILASGQNKNDPRHRRRRNARGARSIPTATRRWWGKRMAKPTSSKPPVNPRSVNPASLLSSGPISYDRVPSEKTSSEKLAHK